MIEDERRADNAASCSRSSEPSSHVLFFSFHPSLNFTSGLKRCMSGASACFSVRVIGLPHPRKPIKLCAEETEYFCMFAYRPHDCRLGLSGMGRPSLWRGGLRHTPLLRPVKLWVSVLVNTLLALQSLFLHCAIVRSSLHSLHRAVGGRRHRKQ